MGGADGAVWGIGVKADMNPSARKFIVGLAVLSGVVAAYLLYVRFGHNPQLDIDTDDLVPRAVREAAEEEPQTSGGRIAGVVVGKVEQTRFFHTDQDGDVDREFGFEELIHSEDDQWVITNPYMRLFLGDFRCRVTADRGQVKVEEDAALGMSPGDARFEGNVVIRVVPTDPNDPNALFIYLDDVSFLADQSMFSTIGAVKFVSRQAQLIGTGMDLLYDQSARQLQLFRVHDLDSLRLRSAEFEALAGSDRDEKAPGDETPVTPVAAAGQEPTAAEATAGETEGAPADPNVYECILFRNVNITTPEQKVTIRDRLVIDNIMWSGSESADEAGEGGPEAGDALKDAKTADAAETPKAKPDEALPYPGPEALDTTPSESLALELIPESLFDIVVTCDEGFVVAPKGSPYLTPDSNAWRPIASRSTADANVVPPAPVVDPNRQLAIVQRIDFDATTTDTTLLGPVTITAALDANDLTGRDADEGYVPVTITAQKAVRYRADENHIQLEGNCAVTLQMTEPNYTYECMLTAPQLGLDLMEDPNAPEDRPGITLRKFVASGGPVAFHVLRKAGDDLVGWVELKAAQLDYAAEAQAFVVSGPGKISLHNGEKIDVGADPNEFDIGLPCYAFMHNFDSLTYTAATHLIVAEAKDRQIQLDYVPQVDGSYDHQEFVEADAGRIEIQLVQLAEDRFDLASIAALEGISFEDNDNQFIGSQLFYDHAAELVTVLGDEVQPCYLNGVLVDRIEMDRKTGRIKAETQTPSVIQINP